MQASSGTTPRAARRSLILIILALSALVVSSALSTDEWIEDSLRWEARTRIIRSALVLEAEILRTELTTVETPTGCQWITEISLHPLAMIWGDCADDTIRAYCAALPAFYHEEGALTTFADSVRARGCVFYQLDEQAPPLPAPGTRGIFQLQEKGPIGGKLNLGVLRHAFQPLLSDSLVTIPGDPGEDDHVWPYADFLGALHEAAASRTLDSLLHADEFVALVRLAPWKERERSRNVRTGRLTVRLPLAVERVYRGEAPPDSCGLVLPIKPARHRLRIDPVAVGRRSSEARRLAVDIPAFPTRRALVVGHVDTTDVFPVDCLPIDRAGLLRLRIPSVSRGAVELYRRYDLSLVEQSLPPLAPAQSDEPGM